MSKILLYYNFYIHIIQETETNLILALPGPASRQVSGHGPSPPESQSCGLKRCQEAAGIEPSHNLKPSERLEQEEKLLNPHFLSCSGI